MKKIYIFALAVIFMFNLIPFATVAAEADNDAYLSQAVRLLEDLGLASSDELFDEPISRGEFVSRTAAVLNIPLSYDYEGSFYNDVNNENPYYYEICNARTWGLISDAEMFYPDRIITYSEAMKITVAAAGYTFYAEAKGGWPSGYMMAANQFGISDGVSGQELDLGTAAVIWYNLLNCVLPEESFTGDGVEHSIDSGVTLIENIWHLKKLSGTFDGAQNFGGPGGNGVGAGFVTLDSVKLRSGEYNTDKYYACEADVYVNDEYEIKSMYVYEGDESAKTLTLYSSDDFSFSSGTYTYYDNNDYEKKASISANAMIVLNGKRSSYSSDKMKPAYGSVRLVETDSSDSGYDVVIIKSYTQYVINDISYSEYTFNDRHNSSVKLSLSDAEYVTYSDQDMRPASFDDIQKLDVVWAAQSEDKTIADVIICRDAILGEYTGLSGSGFYYLDDGKYELDPNVPDSVMTSLRIGDVISAKLNPDGKIVWASKDTESDNSNVAYLMRSALMGKGLDRSVIVKLLKADGNIVTYNLASKLSVNGKSYSDSDMQALYAKLPKDSTVTSSMPIDICSFEINADRKISVINYSDKAAEAFGGLHTNMYQKDVLDETDATSYEKYYQYRPSAKALYGKGAAKIFTTDNTVQFMVPDKSSISVADDKDYAVRKMSYYTATQNYLNKMTHAGYGMSDESLMSDYIVTAYPIAGGGAALGSVDSGSASYMVKEISSILSADGAPAEKIELISYSGNELVLYSEEIGYFDKAGVIKGSIIKVNYDSKSNVSGVVVVYKPGDKVLTNTTNLSELKLTFVEESGNTAIVNASNSGMATLSEAYIFLSTLYDESESIYSFLPLTTAPESYDGTQDMYKFIYSGKQFVCYDSARDEVVLIPPEDARLYKGMFPTYHTAVVEVAYGALDGIFLYQ